MVDAQKREKKANEQVHTQGSTEISYMIQTVQYTVHSTMLALFESSEATAVFASTV